jgi:hypothetical protein
MSFDRNLLPEPQSYFESLGLKLTGPASSKWRTTACMFHGGSDSMRINTQSGGWVCMSCDAKGGDLLAYEMQRTDKDFVTAAKGLGAWIGTDKPPTHHRPAPLPPRAALEVLGAECNLVAIAAGNIAHGVTLKDADRQRLLTAANRITRLAEAYK